MKCEVGYIHLGGEHFALVIRFVEGMCTMQTMFYTVESYNGVISRYSLTAWVGVVSTLTLTLVKIKCVILVIDFVCDHRLEFGVVFFGFVSC